jgi:hypothetical protein
MGLDPYRVGLYHIEIMTTQSRVGLYGRDLANDPAMRLILGKARQDSD